jgi:hypothetical protein
MNDKLVHKTAGDALIKKLSIFKFFKKKVCIFQSH